MNLDIFRIFSTLVCGSYGRGDERGFIEWRLKISDYWNVLETFHYRNSVPVIFFIRTILGFAQTFCLFFMQNIYEIVFATARPVIVVQVRAGGSFTPRDHGPPMNIRRDADKRSENSLSRDISHKRCEEVLRPAFVNAMSRSSGGWGWQRFSQIPLVKKRPQCFQSNESVGVRMTVVEQVKLSLTRARARWHK